jgi:hypothetical protein
VSALEINYGTLGRPNTQQKSFSRLVKQLTQASTQSKNSAATSMERVKPIIQKSNA